MVQIRQRGVRDPRGGPRRGDQGSFNGTVSPWCHAKQQQQHQRKQSKPAEQQRKETRGWRSGSNNGRREMASMDRRGFFVTPPRQRELSGTVTRVRLSYESRYTLASFERVPLSSPIGDATCPRNFTTRGKGFNVR